ncbi:MAG: hypothetical protein ACLP01_10130 [Solirubrobacteraceae bacterium]
MTTTYHDRWIDCTDDGIVIRGYYFPWGAKTIPYERIQEVRVFKISAMCGRGRIWGTSNPRYWASLDPSRPSKQVGLVLDLGRQVRPVITPEDPDMVRACIGAHCRAPIVEPDDERAPTLI